MSPPKTPFDKGLEAFVDGREPSFDTDPPRPAIYDQIDGMRTEIRRGFAALGIRVVDELPPMRGREGSGLDFDALAREVKQAAIEGEQRQGTTAEQLVTSVLRKYRDQRELARRRADENNRKKRARKIMDGILVTLGAGGVGWLAHTLWVSATAHH